MIKCWFYTICFCVFLSWCELSLGCPLNNFQCKKGRCILESFVCDGRVDCTDGSDEEPSLCKVPLAIRLVGGRDNSSGHVEVNFLGLWGTICGSKVGEREGKVICHSLGFKGPFSVHKSGLYEVGKKKIWMGRLKCNGTERNIVECERSPWGLPNCAHRDDVTISCSLAKPPALKKPISCGLDQRNMIGKNYNYNLPQQTYIEINQPSKIAQKLLPPNRHDTLEALIRKRRMVHSKPAKSLSNFPWIAEIRFLASGSSSHYCGATILTEYIVLTAAHCVEGLRVIDYVVRVGEYDQAVRDPLEEDYEVAIIAIHKQFNIGAPLNNDIALVKILPKAGRGIQFSKYVQPICLPSISAPYLETMDAVTAGWGVTEHGNKSNELRLAEVPLISQGACKYFTKYGDKLVTPSMMCAGFLEGGSDACDSDSGGPLVVKINGRFTLLGIISWGYSCGGTKRPGVYTNIQYHLRWIVQQINNLSD